MPRTIIRGGIVINANASFRADVIIDGEQILGVIKDATLIPGDTLINANECYILPGIIDAHTHMQLDTGIHQSGDNWEVGTRAAAWGGITTVIDFATQRQGMTFEETIQRRQEEARSAVIDYGLHCIITDFPYGQERQLQSLIQLGVTSYQVFTTYRPHYCLEDAAILRLMKAATQYGGVVMVHAENDSMIAEMTQALIAQGKTSLAYHGRSRPILAEEEAVNRMLYLAKVAGCSVYIVNCSSARSIDQIRIAVSQGVKAYSETCPQYLLLDESLYLSDTPEFYILQPPLRDKEQLNMLWQHASNGAIDVIATAHCDYSLAQKSEHTTFMQTPVGLPGVETLLTLMYTHSLDKGKLPLTNIVRMLSTNPAKIFGLADRKGDIRAGLDADLVIYDPRPRWFLHSEKMHTVGGYSPYEGHRMRGEVKTVFVRGKPIILDREFIGESGYGKFVPSVP